MASIQFLKTVLTMFYTTSLIVFPALQLMGLNQASSLSDTDSLPHAQYFFYQNSEYPKDCSDIQRQCSTSNHSGVYLIKPHGFREPFEVFCSNDIDSEGWTVIQRREDGLVNFNRSWENYRDGFGFLSTEYFIGNEKLAYLTNQADYELLIEAELENGCFFYTVYKNFRTTDEFGQYRIQPVVLLESNATDCLSGCPANVFFINDCTEMCFCNDGRLNNCRSVRCDDNAMCDVTNGLEICSCNDGYSGDGLSCTKTTTPTTTTTTQPPPPTTTRIPTTDPGYRDCQEVLDGGQTNSGTYTILPDGYPGDPFPVYCKMENGRGWTVFQRRINGNTDFNQNWALYKEGFGVLTDNFWLGNDKLHYITTQKNYIMRFDVTTTDGTSLYAEYTVFEIGAESTQYTMTQLGSRSGSTGDSVYLSRGKKFSTHDRDNDECGDFDCAEGHQSGWWHQDGRCSICGGAFCTSFPYDNSGCHSWCTHENLNGVYNGGNGERIFSGGGAYCSVQDVEMKIRPSP